MVRTSVPRELQSLALVQYSEAIVSVVLATLLRMLLGPYMGLSVPYVTYFLSNAIIIRYTRVGPALFAILTSAVAADYFFLPPLHTLWSPPAHYVTSAIFVLANVINLILANNMRKAQLQAQANAQAARERAALLNLAPVLGRKLNDTVSLWGHGAEMLYGYSESEALGRLSHELLKARFPQPVEKIRAELFARGEWQGEVTHQRKNGETRTVLSQWVLQKDASGQPSAILETNRDITEAKKAQDALRESQTQLQHHAANLENLVQERTAKLQELVADLEHFSYTITHDMRAPLRAMKGFAQLANELCPNGASHEQRLFLERIQTSAERMDALITDALNYNRAVRNELTLEKVELGPLLRGMLDSYPEFSSANAQIQVAPEIPAVLGNEAALTQCFSNIIGNAVKFVSPGQKPVVRVWSELVPQVATPASAGPVLAAGPQPPTTWVRIWVEDNGIGIPESMLPRVFDMFSRGQHTYPGTGIGLALVRKVVQRMGGRVGVDSKLGKGSRFWVDLQLAPGSVPPPQ